MKTWRIVPVSGTKETLKMSIQAGIKELAASPRHCWMCGRKPGRYALYEYGRDEYKYIADHQRVYCEDCIQKAAEEEADLMWDSAQMRSKKMIRNAMNTLEAQNWDMYDGDSRLKWGRLEMALKRGAHRLSSKDEAVAAFLLMDDGCASGVTLNTRLSCDETGESLELDLIKTATRTVIEIDGDMHNGFGWQMFEKDCRILEARPDMTVLRIPTAYLKKYAAFLRDDVEFMENICSEIRAENGGTLPRGYQQELWNRMRTEWAIYGRRYFKRRLHVDSDRLQALKSHVMRYLDGDPAEQPKEPEAV